MSTFTITRLAHIKILGMKMYHLATLVRSTFGMMAPN
jgi:hypothetical protein